MAVGRMSLAIVAAASFVETFFLCQNFGGLCALIGHFLI